MHLFDPNLDHDYYFKLLLIKRSRTPNQLLDVPLHTVNSAKFKLHRYRLRQIPAQITRNLHRFVALGTPYLSRLPEDLVPSWQSAARKRSLNSLLSRTVSRNCRMRSHWVSFDAGVLRHQVARSALILSQMK